MFTSFVASLPTFQRFSVPAEKFTLVTPNLNFVELSWETWDKLIFRKQTYLFLLVVLSAFVFADPDLLEKNYQNILNAALYWIPAFLATVSGFLVLHSILIFYISCQFKIPYFGSPFSAAFMIGATIACCKYGHLIGYIPSDYMPTIGVHIKNIGGLLLCEAVFSGLILPRFLEKQAVIDDAERASAAHSPCQPSIDTKSGIVDFGKVKVASRQICYAKIAEHYLDIYTESHKWTVRSKMEKFIHEVGENSGVQIHRSTWISYHYIDSVKNELGKATVYMKSGESFEVARARKNDVIAAIAKNAGLFPNASRRSESSTNPANLH